MKRLLPLYIYQERQITEANGTHHDSAILVGRGFVGNGLRAVPRPSTSQFPKFNATSLLGSGEFSCVFLGFIRWTAPLFKLGKSGGRMIECQHEKIGRTGERRRRAHMPAQGRAKRRPGWSSAFRVKALKRRNCIACRALVDSTQVGAALYPGLFCLRTFGAPPAVSASPF